MSTHIDKDQFEYYLSSLDELGEILIEADRIESVASGILRLTLGTIMASNGTIFVFDRENSLLSTLSTISVKEKFSSCVLTPQFIKNIKDYQYGHLDYDGTLDWIDKDLKDYLDISNSKIIIPLFHKTKLLGVLSVGEKFMSEVFTDIDYKILEIISNHLTKALFNDKLIKEVENKKTEINLKLLELETLFDISVAISSVLEIDELAEDVLWRSVGILNASKGMLLIQEENKIDIKPSMIQPIQEIKSLGKFKVKISLHSEVDAEITINVTSADTIQ